MIITASCVALALLYRWKLVELFYNKNIWAVGAMLVCFSMLSGYTWNKMRRPPFYHKANEGPVLISNGQKKQYIAESYIVAVLNATVVLGMILAIEGAGGVRPEDRRAGRKKRKLQILAGIALMLAAFATIIAVFRVKRPWYPYGF